MLNYFSIITTNFFSVNRCPQLVEEFVILDNYTVEKGRMSMHNIHLSMLFAYLIVFKGLKVISLDGLPKERGRSGLRRSAWK